MTDVNENELDELMSKLETIAKDYNNRAKQLKVYKRVGIATADYTDQVEELIDDGEEVPENWEPDYDRLWATLDSTAGGWFPSFYSEC